MIAIENENSAALKGVLPKDYARPALSKTMLGDLIDLFSGVGLGDKESKSRDILGRVYEYFLSKFANAEGKGGGEFLYTALRGAAPGRYVGNPTRAGSTIRVAAQAVCSCNRKSSSKNTAGALATSPFMARK